MIKLSALLYLDRDARIVERIEKSIENYRQRRCGSAQGYRCIG